jgi:hypothetical protein
MALTWTQSLSRREGTLGRSEGGTAGSDQCAPRARALGQRVATRSGRRWESSPDVVLSGPTASACRGAGCWG